MSIKEPFTERFITVREKHSIIDWLLKRNFVRSKALPNLEGLVAYKQSMHKIGNFKTVLQIELLNVREKHAIIYGSLV